MKLQYAKALLCSYQGIDLMIEQIDELVERKALFSMDDFRPCEEICNEIIEKIKEKERYIDLKVAIDIVLKKLKEDERAFTEYKFFRRSKKDYSGIQYDCRDYFRRQSIIIRKIATYLEYLGFTDEKIEKEYLTINFFKEVLKRCNEREKLMHKNKSKKADMKRSESLAH